MNSLSWGETIGARVTNNSNGYGFTGSAIASKYDDTRTNGMVHFASAGNSGAPPISYPASLPSVNSVSAVNNVGGLASFSSFGAGLDMAAPGVDIVTTDRTGSDGYGPDDYTVISGTSFASPYAAGVAALVLAVDATLTVEEVETKLKEGAEDLGDPGYDPMFGWGIVNAEESVSFESECGPTSGYCIATYNSTGSKGVITSAGTTSVGENNLVLNASGLPSNQPALFFYGSSTTVEPFGNGFLCIGAPLFRLTPTVTTDSGTASHILDLTDPPSEAGTIGAGQIWNFQLWYRDPDDGFAMFNLTEGLQASFCP